MNRKDYARVKELKAKGDLTPEEKEELKKLTRYGHKPQGNKAKGDKKAELEFTPGNDFSWWNKEPVLLKDAVNLKSNYIPGRQIDSFALPFVYPGVVRYEYIPLYGADSLPTHPINMLSRDLYLRMFQKWRGISAYSASDLGIANIAGIEVVRMVAKLERIYGVINRYSKINANLPFTEVIGLGLTQSQADWIRNHLSDYRYSLNMLLRKAQRLCIPKDMSHISNVISLMGYEYLDHDNIKGQVIIIDTNKFGVYNDTAMDAGCIVFSDYTMYSSVPLIDQSGTGTLFPALDLMISNLVGSDGIQKIYGDLVTWFGSEQMLQFNPLPEEYIVVPAYSESILHKIHNIDPLCAMSGGSSPKLYTVSDTGLSSTDSTFVQGLPGNTLCIYQCNDAIHTKVSVCMSSSPTWIALTPSTDVVACGTSALVSPYEDITILDTYRVDVTDETITEGVLFKHAKKKYDPVSGGTTYHTAELIAVGFELFIRATLISSDSTTDTVFSDTGPIFTSSATAQTAAGKLAIQDWAPLMYYFNGTNYVGAYGDVDTIIPIYPDVKKKALDVIVMSGLKSDIIVVDKNVAR